MILFSEQSEDVIVGGILLRGSGAFAEVKNIILPADFYKIRNSQVFQVMAGLHEKGFEITTITVEAKLTEAGLAWESMQVDLLTLMASALYDDLSTYAYIVAEYAAKRKIRKFGVELSEACEDDFDLDDMLDYVEKITQTLESPTVEGFATMPVFDLIQDELAETQWLVQNLFAVDTRCLVVASEGAGKSVLMRQIAAAIALGIHPFKNQRITPRRVLYIDLENPLHVIHESFMKIVLKLNPNMKPPALLELLHKPEGMDIRSRKDFGMLEAALAKHRPEVVVIAPLYKLGRKRRGESDEDIAADTQAILDDLRIRFGFTLLIEHHAPKAQGGSREMTAYGSSLWLRWPELGISFDIDRDDPNLRNVSRFRGDRHLSEWPRRFVKGSMRPWEAIY